MAGLRHINGYPGQAPPRNGISLGDTLAAQSAFQGILLALYARDARGGGGQVVDASITDACFAVTESAVLEFEKTGWVREPTGPRLPRIAPSNVYRSSDDRWVVIAANHDTLWRRLAELMGRPELGEDERFATHNARGENEDELDELIGEWAARHTAEELDRIVNDAGVVCARVYSAADVYEDPYFRERELLVEHEDEVHGTVTVPGVVPKLSATPGAIRQPARWTVGADTDDVLGRARAGGRRHRRPARAGDRVIVCDVGPRDGLQNDDVTLAPAVRAELCDRLAATGLPRVEAVSFVHPERVPQMAGAEEVLAAVERREGVVHAALVLNERGLQRAIDAGVEEVHVAYPVTDTFCERNQNATTEQAAAACEAIVARAHDAGMRATVTLAAAFGCPFEGRVDPGVVIEHAHRQAARRRADARRHDRRRRARPGAAAAARRARDRRAGRAAPPQHAQHRLRQRGRRGWSTAPRSSTRASAAWADARSPRAPPATSPPRTSSTCSRARASTPGSTPTASPASPSGWAGWSAATYPGWCTAPARSRNRSPRPGSCCRRAASSRRCGTCACPGSSCRARSWRRS